MTRTHKHIKRPYASPEIIQSVEIRLEVDFLGSVVDKLNSPEGGAIIEPQEVQYESFETAGYNYDWK